MKQITKSLQTHSSMIILEDEHGRWTWKSPNGQVRNTIGKRFRNAIKYSKSHPETYYGSDHNPVICKIAIKLRKLRRTQQSPQLQYKSLQVDQEKISIT